MGRKNGKLSKKEIIDAVRRYLAHLPSFGIHAQGAILFGSYARGNASPWSDIDLIVIAPEFDRKCTMKTVDSLWYATLKADIRIEPIPCGVREWETDHSRPILEIARQEGILISA